MENLSLVKNDNGLYQAKGCVKPEDIIKTASDILFEDLSQREALTNSMDAARFLQLALACEKNENFAALFLDNQHRVISFEKMFKGTIDGASVHPRVVVQSALACNAAAVLFAHNHPSNHCEPSEADKHITRRLIDALALVDVRVLDHFIVSKSGWVSLADRGLI